MRRKADAGVSHHSREALGSRYPVHVTTRLRRGLPRLRNRRTRAVLWEAFHEGADRFGFRLVQFSIQSNHLHLIAEAKDRRALSRGLQGLFIRVAKALNRLWARAGRVFADRYHDRILRTPTEVRNALAYVFGNANHHGALPDERLWDPFSSGAWFDGWREELEVVGGEGVPRPVADAHTWLLSRGWRRARGGRLSLCAG